MPEIEELPAGQDTFDRAYVEKLRAEAAKYRTEAKQFKEAFTGLNDGEVEFILDKVSAIAENPESGSLGLLEIATEFLGEDKVFEALDIEIDDGEPVEDGEEEEGDVSAAEELKRLLDERDAAAAEAAEEAAAEAAREEVYAEIEAAGFERGTPGFQHALSIGRTEAMLNNEVDFTALAPRIAAAAGIEDFTPPVTEDTDASGEPKPTPTGKHPTTAGAGGTGAATESETDWIADAKESGQDLWDAARTRAEARRGG